MQNGGAPFPCSLAWPDPSRSRKGEEEKGGGGKRGRRKKGEEEKGGGEKEEGSGDSEQDVIQLPTWRQSQSDCSSYVIALQVHDIRIERVT